LVMGRRYKINSNMAMQIMLKSQAFFDGTSLTSIH